MSPSLDALWDRINFVASLFCSTHGLLNGVTILGLQRDWASFLHDFLSFILSCPCFSFSTATWEDTSSSSHVFIIPSWYNFFYLWKERNQYVLRACYWKQWIFTHCFYWLYIWTFAASLQVNFEDTCKGFLDVAKVCNCLQTCYSNAFMIDICWSWIHTFSIFLGQHDAFMIWRSMCNFLLNGDF